MAERNDNLGRFRDLNTEQQLEQEMDTALEINEDLDDAFFETEGIEKLPSIPQSPAFMPPEGMYQDA